MRNIKWLVGTDPFSDYLAVVPHDQASRDVEAIKTILTAKTLGEVRRSAPALEIVKSRYDAVSEDEHIDVAALPEETPFDHESWFGPEDISWMPLVRLRTAAMAPPALLSEFGREDHEFGMDYEPARWFSVDDQETLEARLTEMGDEVVHDEALLDAYLG
jgi:hypothetical protein